jgi:hypothetical protein
MKGVVVVGGSGSPWLVAQGHLRIEAYPVIPRGLY